MSKTFNKMVLGALALVLALPVSAFAAIGTNGSFESGTSSGGSNFITLNAPNTSDITGWKVVSGSIDYLQNGWQAADGSRSIDLNGLAAGTVSQTFATVPGRKYEVTFLLSGNPDSRPSNDPLYSPSKKVVKVSAIGCSGYATFTYDTADMKNTHADMKFVTKKYTFRARKSSTTLTFSSMEGGAFGPVIDNVVVTKKSHGHHN